MARIVIIGRRSLLATRFKNHLTLFPQEQKHEVVTFAHDEDIRLDGADVVVNFAFHPRLRSEPYLPELDIDRTIATSIPPTCRYVMLSSRLVYGRAACGSRTSDPARPSDVYGENKLWVETHLRTMLGERLTVLRISNPLIYRPGHPQFISNLMDSLQRDNEVRLDVSPFVCKDFVPDWYLMGAIATACTMVETGTFNVGAGQGIEVGKIALWVIEGNGGGKLVVTDPRTRDEFWLDMSCEEKHFGPVPSRNEIADACRRLGRSIAQ